MSRLTKRQAERIMRENDGNLPLGNSDITQLPKNLNVSGYLDISNTPIQELPIGLKVQDYLRASNTKITSLTNDLYVGDELDLTGTPIKEIKNPNINVGILNCSNTPLEKLPDNFTVGTLYADRTQLKELPKNLKIALHLDISDTKITKIPSDISIGGDFYANRSPINELPNIQFYGDIELNGTQIKTLPEIFTTSLRGIGGNLKLNNTPIEKLPEDLFVKGDLSIRSTKIIQIPKGLHVCGNLDISNTPILQQVPSHKNNIQVSGEVRGKMPSSEAILRIMKNNNGNLDLRDIPITSLPKLKDGINVDGYLDLRRTLITELPDNLTVKNALIINQTPIEELPNNLKVGTLILSEKQLEKINLPKDMVCGGYGGESYLNYELRKSHIRVVTTKDNLYGDLHMPLDDYYEKKARTTTSEQTRENLDNNNNESALTHNNDKKTDLSSSILPNSVPSAGFSQTM